MAYQLKKTTPNKEGFQDIEEILAISEDKEVVKTYAKKELGVDVSPIEFFTWEPYYQIEPLNALILASGN